MECDMNTVDVSRVASLQGDMIVEVDEERRCMPNCMTIDDMNRESCEWRVT